MLYTKQKAGALVQKALNKGIIKRKPCEVCSELKVDGHHEDYSDPLGITWLCRKHHRIWHVENGSPKAKEIDNIPKGFLKDLQDDLVENLQREGFSSKDINIIFNKQLVL
jgi:hypothetical protein|tara:strand:+ start:1795 stop:2124 length:330 start_codon:yes stop_codon:yes gene_type:complete